MSGVLGLLLIAALTLVVALVAGRLRIHWRVKRLLLAGLALRVLGALAYLYVIGAMYGVGDYLAYFDRGISLSEGAGAGGALFEPGLWLAGRWWGTAFVEHVTGVFVHVFGPTLPGAFIAFSLLSYVGIVALGLAFFRAFPEVPPERYLAWIVLFPSLWFWPSALGKDALVLCGLGVATLGFVGRRGRVGWGLMALGTALVFAVRPQVAVTVAFALGMGHWLGTARRWSLGRVLQGAVLLAVGLAVVAVSSGALGVELFRPDEVESYLASRASVSSRGGSSLATPSGGFPVWMAPVNSLFRPFPWEARGATALIASLEVAVLWAVAWWRRRQVVAFVRRYREHRLFWMAAVFVLVYATALGMAVGNLGILARQRVHLLPFLFMFIAGEADRRTAGLGQSSAGTFGTDAEPAPARPSWRDTPAKAG